MSMIRITVEASIFPLNEEIGIGGSNPRIFSGEFSFEIPDVPELPDLWKTAKRAHVGGLSIFIVGKSKPESSENRLYGQAYLQSVTPEHFAELQSLGWKIDEEAAAAKGYPREAIPKAVPST